VSGDLDDGRDATSPTASDQLLSLNLAIEELAKVEPELASTSTRFASVIATEVVHDKRLAAGLSEALSPTMEPIRGLYGHRSRPSLSLSSFHDSFLRSSRALKRMRQRATPPR
jgi:hypothetical protein